MATCLTDPGHQVSSFSLANGRGRHQGDLPRLLRRMATEIAQLGPQTMVLDFTVHDEPDDLDSFFSATVYYAFDGWADGDTDLPSATD